MFGFEGMNPQRCSSGVWIRFPHVGPVAQLVRASPCHGEGRRFESVYRLMMVTSYGWIPEWPKGTDCKSAANCFGGSNPPPSTWQMPDKFNKNIAGWSSLEARRAHNPKVIGSNPVPATSGLKR